MARGKVIGTLLTSLLLLCAAFQEDLDDHVRHDFRMPTNLIDFEIRKTVGLLAK